MAVVSALMSIGVSRAEGNGECRIASAVFVVICNSAYFHPRIISTAPDDLGGHTPLRYGKGARRLHRCPSRSSLQSHGYLISPVSRSSRVYPMSLS